jgi:hypothetical protein
MFGSALKLFTVMAMVMQDALVLACCMCVGLLNLLAVNAVAAAVCMCGLPMHLHALCHRTVFLSERLPLVEGWVHPTQVCAAQRSCMCLASLVLSNCCHQGVQPCSRCAGHASTCPAGDPLV